MKNNEGKSGKFGEKICALTIQNDRGKWPIFGGKISALFTQKGKRKIVENYRFLSKNKQEKWQKITNLWRE